MRGLLEILHVEPATDSKATTLARAPPHILPSAPMRASGHTEQEPTHDPPPRQSRCPRHVFRRLVRLLRHDGPAFRRLIPANLRKRNH